MEGEYLAGAAYGIDNNRSAAAAGRSSVEKQRVAFEKAGAGINERYRDGFHDGGYHCVLGTVTGDHDFRLADVRAAVEDQDACDGMLVGALGENRAHAHDFELADAGRDGRSEERRVGKEWRY